MNRRLLASPIVTVVGESGFASDARDMPEHDVEDELEGDLEGELSARANEVILRSIKHFKPDSTLVVVEKRGVT